MSEVPSTSEKARNRGYNSPVKRQKVAEENDFAAGSISDLTFECESLKDTKKLNLNNESSFEESKCSPKRKLNKISKPSPLGLPKKNLTADAFFIKQVSWQCWNVKLILYLEAKRTFV